MVFANSDFGFVSLKQGKKAPKSSKLTSDFVR